MKLYQMPSYTRFYLGNKVASKSTPQVLGEVIGMTYAAKGISYPVKWDDPKLGVTEEYEDDLVPAVTVQSNESNSAVKQQPPPPSCDCGARAVGSSKHSTWCTLSELTSLS